MLDFVGWLWILFFLFQVAYSHVPVTGICNSEEVTSLNIRQGRDAMFGLDQKLGNDAQRIMWILTSKQLILANISAGESSPDRINNSKQYKRRLSLLPDKSLMLSNLTTEDSGCYEAEVKSVSGGITTQKFNLTVLGTDHTEPNMNPQNRLWVFPLLSLGVFLFLLILCDCYLRPQDNCIYKIKGTLRRSKSQTEETGAEEQYKHSQMASLYTDEERLRTPGRALPVTTIQEDVVEMLNEVDTQQENSRDQHR